MKANRFAGKALIYNDFAKELIYINLAFLLGYIAFAVFSPSLSEAIVKIPVIANLDLRIFGCALILLIIQLSSFSMLGPLIIPVADCMFGYFMSLSLDSIISAGSASLVIILKLFPIWFAAVFICTFVSAGSMKSSERLFLRYRNERYIKLDLVKTLLLVLSFVILSFIGISDINILL